MSIKHRSLLGAAFLVVPTLVSAQATPTVSSTQQRDTTQLNSIVITANRQPTPLSSITQAVTVLQGDDLRARGINTVALALREVPGAALAQNGSYGSVTSLFVRGGESRYTKVLIDGVPINTLGSASFSFANLSTDNIDRIEVLRGPASALYGADAVSGVVQIFTRQGTPGTMRLTAEGRAGTYGSQDGHASVSGGHRFGTYSFGGGVQRTDGVLTLNNRFSLGTLSGAVAITPDAVSRITLTSRYTGAEYRSPMDYNDVPFDTNAYSTQHRLVLGLSAVRTLASWLAVDVSGADNEIHDNNYRINTTGTGSTATYDRTGSPAHGYRRNADVRAIANYGSLATVTFGGRYEKEYQQSWSTSQQWTGTNTAAITSTQSARANNDRTTRSAYMAVQGAPLSRFSYDASVRHDDYSDFKNITTYRGGLRVALLNNTALRTSYGTAFNAPTFAATQGSAFNTANPNLQPEQAHTIDAALEHTLWNGRVRASVGVFDQHFSQVVQYVSAPFPAPGHYENMTQSRAKGYESELHAILFDGLTTDLNYVQTIAKVYSVNPTYTGSQQPGDELLRRPSHSGSANVAYARRGLGSIAATALYVGKHLDQNFTVFPSPTVTLPSYVKVDLSASADVIRRPGQTVALTARLENALNKKYEDVLHYQTPSRAFFLGARLSANR